MTKENKLVGNWGHILALAVLLGSFVAYFITYNYFLLLTPFVFLIIAATGANWKFVWWMFLFTMPLSIHLFILGKSLSTSLPDEPMMWVFLLMFIIMFASNPKILPQWWWRNPIVLIVALQFLWLIVPISFSEETFYSIKFLLAKSWFLVAFFILPVFIFKEKKDFKKAFWLLFIPILATTIVIFYRHKTFNFSFTRIERAINHLYYNHVEYSTVISMFFPVVFIAFLLVKNKRWLKWTLGITLLFLLPAIYLTYARAAMLAVVFAFIINIAIRLRLVNLVMPVFYAGIIALLFYVTDNNRFIAYRPNYQQTYMHGTFADHMVATFRGRDMSSMERVYRWIASFRMSKERPITGYGPNSFYYHYKPYAISMFRTYVSRNEERSTTHNYFIFMLVGQGWPAMLLYAVLVIVVFAQAQKIYYRFRDPFYKKVTMAVIMVFAAGFVNNFFSELIETHKVGGLFYLSLAMLVILDRKSRKKDDGEIMQDNLNTHKANS